MASGRRGPTGGIRSRRRGGEAARGHRVPALGLREFPCGRDDERLSFSSFALTVRPGPARPHFHTRSAEMFYILDGTAQLLSGDRVVTAEQGDLVVVPPGAAHAFAAAPGQDSDILIVITPGVERFEYFRHLERVGLGKVPPETLLEVQELYDNHFLASEAWEGRRD
ncbi:cupin domain-containing protein [Streptomyces sp. WAC07094]|uniref:cupin domain-containing protein n=1 Tax=Streptomyces sp. WAC07094 TaxID=3072183 RepID=UPI002E9E88C8|nr:cupin domain-containing protein [Streptomyces sp. WAC07094]